MVPAIALGLLLPATVAAGYYFALTALGWRNPQPRPDRVPSLNIAVVIPAHDEELLIGRAVRSVLDSDYSADRVRVLVVADKCADRTSEMARAAGADVVERCEPDRRGKGYALALGIDRALAGDADAVLVLDADCVLARDALRRLVAVGAEAVQASRVPHNCDGPAAAVAAVGSEIENAVSAGRDRLGLTVPLRGSGMLFRRGLLERVPWRCVGLVEDAEYTTALTRAGVRVRFVPDAVVFGDVPADANGFAKQRRRWRAAVFTRGPGVLSRALASKPLVLVHLAATMLAVGVLSTGWPFVAWAAGLVAMTAAVYIRAIRRSGVGRLRGTALLTARLAGLTLLGATDRGRAWERTPRV